MKTLRYWLKARFAWLRVPIRSGPLRGQWIGLFCGMRFIRGRYDRSAVQQFVRLIPRDATVYDIGAHVGYLTMLAAQQVGPQGTVVAIEPLALNLKYLRAHLRANRIANVNVLAACVAETAGFADFDHGKGTGRGRLGTLGHGAMKVVSLDDEIDSGRIPPPHFIKMDVEGAELLALRGALRCLALHRPTVLLSVHSTRLRDDCGALLRTLDYRIESGSKPGEMLAYGDAPVATTPPGVPLAAAINLA